MSSDQIPTKELLESASERLKEIPEVKPSSWSSFVKTGHFKERTPDKEWWYIRSASILRKIHLLGPVGVSKLRVKYGGKKNRGLKPERFNKASGNHIRKILQQLEKAGLVEQKTIKNHKGRVITKKGKELLYNGPRTTSKATATNSDAGNPIKTKPNKRSSN